MCLGKLICAPFHVRVSHTLQALIYDSAGKRCSESEFSTMTQLLLKGGGAHNFAIRLSVCVCVGGGGCKLCHPFESMCVCVCVWGGGGGDMMFT